MYKSVLFSYDRVFDGTFESLRRQFNECEEKFRCKTSYTDKFSPIWIIRGCMDYFDALPNGFLGKHNGSGIPDVEADRFANNIERLKASICQLSDGHMWGVDITELETDKLQTLVDIRTLIVHSGKPLKNLKSDVFKPLRGYKNIQLDRLACNDGLFPGKYQNMDYCVTVWADDHSTKDEYCLSVYFNQTDIENFVFCYIQDFVEICKKER